MSTGPLVSVIIPTYNRASEFHRSVDSVVAQTWRPLQLVLVNDGSTDNTSEAMTFIEPKVRDAGVEPLFINQPNGGCASARNTAVNRSTGAYFAFLDDDDEWLPTKIEKQVAEVQRTDADACCTQARKLVTRGEIIQPPDPANLIRGVNPGRYMDRTLDAHLITLLVARTMWEVVGEFDTDLKTGSDTEWIARLSHYANFCAVPEILAVYTYSDTALSRIDSMDAELARDARRRLALEKIKQKCAHLPNWDEQAWRKRAAGAYSDFVKHLLYAGDLPSARRMYDEGMRITGAAEPLPGVKRKLRKAWWLSLVGKRLRHPKLRVRT
ncbi:MAG: glycosyltransferase [Planctomycetes bacterium]|nr:glycosyltransferase [Planctomycetota bacterium]